MVDAYLAFKLRDRKPVLNPAIAAATGLDRKTVTAATKALVQFGLAKAEGRGHVSCDPAPDSEGSGWRVRAKHGPYAAYNFYVLTDGAKRSRFNPSGVLSEMDNAILMLLRSLADGDEVLNQTVKGLVTMLGCSVHTVNAGIKTLAANGLLGRRTGGFTLVPPTEVSSAWWQDRKTKIVGGVEVEVEPLPPPKLKISGEDTGGSLAPFFKQLTRRTFPGLDAEDEVYLLGMLEAKAKIMAAGRCSKAEIQAYWSRHVPSFEDSMKLFLHLAGGDWLSLWKEASVRHGETGKYRNCINLLNALTFGGRTVAEAG
jgi:biotin operon repressor